VRPPKGWALRPLINVASKPQYGWTSSAKIGAVGLPLLRTTDITRGPIDWSTVPRCTQSPKDPSKYLLEDGDIVVSRAGSVGVSALVRDPPESVFASYLMRVRPGPDIDPAFLRLFLLSPGYWRQVSDVTDGIAMPNINGTKLAAVEVPLPPPDEQRRIVDILEDHLSRLDAADKGLFLSLAKLNSLREQTIIHALTAAVVPDRVDAALADVGTADGDLPSLPVGWSCARLGDVAEVVGGVTKDAKKQGDPSFVDVPYLRVANVQRGHLDLDTVTHIRVAPAKAKALRLEEGDVLLNEGGDRDKLARGWVWEGQIHHCIHQNHVFRARLHEPRLDPYFLSWTANTFGGRWAERNGKQSVNLASISLSMIRKMPVIVPPDGEAQRIVALLREQLESYDRLESALTDSRNRGTALRRSLLAAAFSGGLTGQSTDLDHAEEMAGA